LNHSAWRATFGATSHLLEETLPTKDPFKLFDVWFGEVARLKGKLSFEEINAVSVSTVSAEGRPSSRMVLLKSHDETGFTFCTNYGSRKGTELAENAYAAMLFYWPQLHRQVRVEGVIEKIPENQSDDYWNARPIASRISAKASDQSTVIPDREHLTRRQQELEQAVESQGEDAAAKPVGCGGLLLRPTYFEFWQGQQNRMHDRISFSTKIPASESTDFIRSSDRPGWLMFRLAP
ncbi:hypothetical protein PENTCL1PPCAC_3335, partial [Pristionchus entomophagus]